MVWGSPWAVACCLSASSFKFTVGAGESMFLIGDVGGEGQRVGGCGVSLAYWIFCLSLPIVVYCLCLFYGRVFKRALRWLCTNGDWPVLVVFILGVCFNGVISY